MSSADMTKAGCRRNRADPGLDREAGAAGPEVVPLGLVAHAHVREQPRQQRLVDPSTSGRGVRPRRAPGRVEPLLPRRLPDLGVQVLPLADAQVVEELALHSRRKPLRLRCFWPPAGAPQVEQRDEVGLSWSSKRAWSCVGRPACPPDRSRWVLDGQRRDDDEHLRRQPRGPRPAPCARAAGRGAGRAGAAERRSGGVLAAARPARTAFPSLERLRSSSSRRTPSAIGAGRGGRRRGIARCPRGPAPSSAG